MKEGEWVSLKLCLECIGKGDTYVELIGNPGIVGCHLDVNGEGFEVGKFYEVVVTECTSQQRKQSMPD